jgi:peptide/nickel transport system substrate-binding protein
MDRRDFMTSGAALALPLTAVAQERPKDVLVVANEFGPNSLDIHTVGANRPSYGVSWLCYDRLMTYGRKTLPDGRVMYDIDKLEPELAESWKVAPDGNSVTFKLRKNAKFHDGTPVTAKDVKWSFDRAVTVGGFPTFQMAAGSLEKPEQFVVVDDHTFTVKFLRRDKLTMNDLAVVVPCVFNSELVKKNATPQDPWGLAWTRNNVAGGGAYKVESWRPGQEIVYVRFDDWKSGPLPKLRRVIQRDVPNAGNRRALLLKGDIDITFDLPPKDFSELAKEGGNVKVATMPIENSMFYLGMNVTKPPFDNPNIRQAVAYVLPYDRMYDNALYGRGIKLYGAASPQVKTTAWPQPTAYKTDLAKAKALMAEAGVPNGFETTLSFDLGGATIGEPMAVLIQESLAQIGIKADQQDPRRHLAFGAAEEGHAAAAEPLRRLAELPRVLLLLVLPRPERRVQHDELPEPEARQDDRQRALRRKQAAVRRLREGHDPARLHRGAAHPAVPADDGRGDAEERDGLPVLVPPAARLPPAVQGLTRRSRPWTTAPTSTPLPPRWG